MESLSARRAWIEITDDFEPSTTRRVALRKESVDRNKAFPGFLVGCIKSLSARRAWIEMQYAVDIPFPGSVVALRKESVDRNP